MPPRRSNKTAHVLSLLTDPKPNEQPTPSPKTASRKSVATDTASTVSTQSPAAEVQQPAPTPVQQHTPPPPPLPSTEERLAQCILDSLTASLEQDEPKTSSSSVPTPPPQKHQPVDQKSSVRRAGSAVLVNVIEELLEQMLDEFMQKFGVCDCPRCRLDVFALTLSRLNACKYLVLEESAVPAMLNLFEHQYSGMISAQLTQACLTVMQNPRHPK